MACAVGPPSHCGSLQLWKPAEVEPCNTQPCPLPPGKDTGGGRPDLCPTAHLASMFCLWAFVCPDSPPPSLPLLQPSPPIAQLSATIP